MSLETMRSLPFAVHQSIDVEIRVWQQAGKSNTMVGDPPSAGALLLYRPKTAALSGDPLLRLAPALCSE